MAEYWSLKQQTGVGSVDAVGWLIFVDPNIWVDD